MSKDFTKTLITSFILTISIGLFVQLILIKQILPIFIDNFDGSLGLLPNRDWIMFHNEALSLLKTMESEGFQKWTLHPNNLTSGITGLLALVYYLLSPNPVFFLIVNASLMSISIALLKATYLPNTKLAFTHMIFFPSILIMYTQIHNDIFSFCALCTILYTVRLTSNNLHTFLGFLVSFILLFLTRSYLITIYYFVFSIYLLIQFYETKKFRYILIKFLHLTISFALIYFLNIYHTDDSSNSKHEWQTSNSKHEWQTIRIIPQAVDKQFYKLSKYRAGFNKSSNNANSAIDQDIEFNSTLNVLQYLPRAFYVSILEPRPKISFNKNQSTLSIIENYVASFEMILVYIILFLTLTKAKKLINKIIELKKEFICLSIILTIQGLVFSNMGTLYRMRMPYYVVMIFLLIITLSDYYKKQNISLSKS